MRRGAGSGARGVGWVVLQSALMVLIVCSWRVPAPDPSTLRRTIGLVLAAPGLVLFLWAYRTLGRSFTPFPVPRPRGVLVEGGPFRLVRHPVYGALLLLFAGLSTAFAPYGLIATAALAVVWWRKSLFEERVLAGRFPGYAAYRERVRRRFLPWVV